MPSLAEARQAFVGADPDLIAPLDALECPICFNALERPTRTACSHWFCRWGFLQGFLAAQSRGLLYGVVAAACSAKVRWRLMVAVFQI